MDEMLVMKRALERYGVESQLYMAIEEMSELTKELCKQIRGKGNRNHIAEELADVSIMLHQVMTIFDCERDMDEWMKKKIKRLADRMEKEG